MKHSPRLEPAQKEEFFKLREELKDTVKAVTAMWEKYPQLVDVLTKHHAHNLWYMYQKNMKIRLPKKQTKEIVAPKAPGTPVAPPAPPIVPPAIQTFEVDVPDFPSDQRKTHRQQLFARAEELRATGMTWSAIAKKLANENPDIKTPSMASMIQRASHQRKAGRAPLPQPKPTGAIAKSTIQIITSGGTIQISTTKDKLLRILAVALEEEESHGS